MAPRPTFTPADEQPEWYGDALDDVLQLDIQMRNLAARKAVALVRAHAEMVGKVDFGYRLLANRSFRAEIAVALRISERAAENLIGYSRVLVDAFPATLAAVESGAISWQHATVIADELGGLEQRARSELEKLALEQASELTANKLGRLIRQARDTRNPETIPERHKVARQFRDVEVADGRDGLATLFLTASAGHVHAIFNKATAAAKAADGPLEDRTLAQRRADILIHMLLATVDGVPFGVVPDEWDDENFVQWYRGIKAEVVVSVPVLTLLGQSDEPATLDGWCPIDPDTARILAGSAKSFIRVLTHPESGTVLSVGRRRYKVPKDLRRHIEIRDLTCRFPGCSIAAHRCDIDHSLDWQYEGETSHINLAAMCRGHHTLKGNTAWTVVQSTDGSGTMTWTSPTGRTYRTMPHRPFAA
jgi:hypothetical protein